MCKFLLSLFLCKILQLRSTVHNCGLFICLRLFQSTFLPLFQQQQQQQQQLNSTPKCPENALANALIQPFQMRFSSFSFLFFFFFDFVLFSDAAAAADNRQLQVLIPFCVFVFVFLSPPLFLATQHSLSGWQSLALK